MMAKSQNRETLIFRVAIPVPLYRLFDYLPPESFDPSSIEPGIRVEVPFGKSSKIAFVVECVRHSDLAPGKLKAVERILDEKSLLSAKDLELLHWAAAYYHHPLGDVFSTAFPVALRQGKPVRLTEEQHYVLTDAGKALNPEDLKKAPKQQGLLQQFKAHAGGLSERELADWDKNWRAPLKQLTTKGWLTSAAAVSTGQETLCRDNALQCNPPQQAAVDAVCESLGQFGVFLLEGVTGSGKTEVYMQIIRTVLERQQQVLVLLPEITLTPQLEARFRQRFTVDIAVSHSKLTDRQRAVAWLEMQQGRCSILLGTRSALFTPLTTPGLIILDEEHDTSFKQQEGFRFSARDVAVMRGKLLNIPVLLGSATPSLESLNNTAAGRYRLLHLPERAGNAAAPALFLMDIRNKKMREGLSETLIAEIRKTTDRNEQVLLFLNRRGFAPTLICHGCGWVARCHHCDANMVIHYDEGSLRCHHCDRKQRLLDRCPACTTGELTPLGLGTERVEKALGELFPDKRTIRLDRDSTQRKGSLENYLQLINRGETDIILGTQMLAKGHHFPNVTMVAILDVDSGLFSIDFHAPEKLAQMIMQVSGRAGRAEKPGRVLMQTRQPDHPLLTTLIREGYNRFAQNALAERKAASLPPFSFQALLRVQSPDAELSKQFLHEVVLLTQTFDHSGVQVLGPVAAPMAKRAGLFRYQLLLQSGKRPALHSLLDDLMPAIEKLKQTKKVHWSLDVDPVDLY